jgi:hypothetical protein
VNDRPPENVCPICRHEYERRELTKHHLVPKCRKGRETVLVCRPCHAQIHATFGERELERRFGTVDELLAAEALQPWVAWSRRRKPTKRIRVKRSHRRR